MKFSKDTLTILKNFSSINPGIVLKPGNFIMTRAINKTVYADATIADEIDSEMPIYDLPGFLNILALVGEDATITHNEQERVAVIKNDRTEVFFATADLSTIVVPKNPIGFPVADVIFELKAEDLQQITKMTRAVGADTIAIESLDNKIVINGYNKAVDANLEKVLFSIEVGEWESSETFKFVINMNNMKVLMSDYKIMISSKGAVKFETPTFKYVIVLEQESNHTF